MIEADQPQEVSETIEPYMDLMSWDVHAVVQNDYATTIEDMRREFGSNE